MVIHCLISILFSISLIIGSSSVFFLRNFQVGDNVLVGFLSTIFFFFWKKNIYSQRLNNKTCIIFINILDNIQTFDA